jgi:hypothetical protein
MRGKQIKFQSDSVMADVYFGVTVAGLYTVVRMGLIIVLKGRLRWRPLSCEP